MPTGDIQLRYRNLLRQTCIALDVRILKGVVSKDHIHLHVSYLPALALRGLVRQPKGHITALLLQEFPELKSVLGQLLNHRET
ncbi:transposase [Hymenobacter sp. UYAg731]